MLTKDDLQQIRGVVRDEVKSEVGTQLKGIKEELGVVKTDVRAVKTDLGIVKTEVAAVKTDLGIFREEARTQLKASEKRLSGKLRKIQNSVLQYHDEYAIYLRERIEKLEQHTGLVKPNKN